MLTRDQHIYKNQVDLLLGKAQIKKNIFYLVKWLGQPIQNSTWESSHSLISFKDEKNKLNLQIQHESLPQFCHNTKDNTQSMNFKQQYANQRKVETILGKRKNQNKKEYLIKWLNYPLNQSNWIQSHKLQRCCNKVKQFNDKFKNQPLPYYDPSFQISSNLYSQPKKLDYYFHFENGQFGKIVGKRKIGVNIFYLIKWKGKGVQCCTWEESKYLYRVSNYQAKLFNNLIKYQALPYFNPDYLNEISQFTGYKIDRQKIQKQQTSFQFNYFQKIIGKKRQLKTYYLIKWQGVQAERSTWQLNKTIIFYYSSKKISDFNTKYKQQQLPYIEPIYFDKCKHLLQPQQKEKNSQSQNDGKNVQQGQSFQNIKVQDSENSYFKETDIYQNLRTNKLISIRRRKSVMNEKCEDLKSTFSFLAHVESKSEDSYMLKLKQSPCKDQIDNKNRELILKQLGLKLQTTVYNWQVSTQFMEPSFKQEQTMIFQGYRSIFLEQIADNSIQPIKITDNKIQVSSEDNTSKTK